MSKRPATKTKPVSAAIKQDMMPPIEVISGQPLKRKNVSSAQPTSVKKQRSVKPSDGSKANKPVTLNPTDGDNDDDPYGTTKFKIPGAQWKSVSLLQNTQVSAGSKELEGLVCIEVCDGSAFKTKKKKIIYADNLDMSQFDDIDGDEKKKPETSKTNDKKKTKESVKADKKKQPTPQKPTEQQQKPKTDDSKKPTQKQQQQKQQQQKSDQKDDKKSEHPTPTPTPQPTKPTNSEKKANDQQADGKKKPVDKKQDDKKKPADNKGKADGKKNPEKKQKDKKEPTPTTPTKPSSTDTVQATDTTTVTIPPIDTPLGPDMLPMSSYIGVTMADIEEEEGTDYTHRPYYLSPNAVIFHHHQDYLAWIPYDLHPLLLLSLIKQGFKAPRPIQSECLLPAMRDWKDVVGAAQTGSGKTLAFILPVLQHIITLREARDEYHIWEAKMNGDHSLHFNDPLSALILTPTRELAMQIKDTIEITGQYAFIKPVTLVGGLYIQKHIRQLQKNIPIIVGTPGRVWDLLQRSEAGIDLSHLRFFILDEADRMVANGHFSELDHIIAMMKVHQLGQAKDTQLLEARDEEIDRRKFERSALIRVDDDEDDDDNDDGDGDGDDENIGEDDDIMQDDDMMEDEDEDEDDNDHHQEDENGNDEDDGEHDDEQTIFSNQHLFDITPVKPQKIQSPKPRHVQIFLFSATLTIQDNARAGAKDDYDPREMIKNQQKKNDPNAIADDSTKEKQYDEDGYEIIEEQTREKGKAMLKELASRLTLNRPIVIDLSSQFILPDGLRQYAIESEADEKDMYLYGLVYELQERTLVFMNSIHMVRRTTDLLRELGIDAFPLHAEMEQKHRLKIIDQFRNACNRIERLKNNDTSDDPTMAHKKRNRRRGGGTPSSGGGSGSSSGGVPSIKGAVLVCTDVASRGLDLPNIDRVIHYHLPRDAETYVHRSGRTARSNRDGKSIALISAQEDHQWKRVQHALEIGVGSKSYSTSSLINRITFNSKFMKDLRERIRLAKELANYSREEKDEARQRKWAKDLADSCGYDLDDDEFDGINKKLLESEGSGRRKHEAIKLTSKLQKAKDALRQLLNTKIFTRGGYYDL